MNNLGSVLKDVARYENRWYGCERGLKRCDNPAAHSNVLFTLVGYELEPAKERLQEAERFAAASANTHSSAGEIASQNQILNGASRWDYLSGLLPTCSELFRRTSAGTLGSQ